VLALFLRKLDLGEPASSTFLACAVFASPTKGLTKALKNDIPAGLALEGGDCWVMVLEFHHGNG
jgi:hypothetical protein